MQNGRQLSGTLSANGLVQRTPAPPEAADVVSDPRRLNSGVESAYNVWADRDGDFLSSMDVKDTLNDHERQESILSIGFRPEDPHCSDEIRCV